MSAKTVSWKFERVGPMGGATGTAFVNTLTGTGDSEEELAREGIQNSCDAAEKNQRVKVVFRVKNLEGSARTAFAERLKLVEGFRPRLKQLRLPRQNWLSNPSGSLSLTYIEDYGTVGLFGDPHKSESNFFKLLLSLGDVSKASAGEASGGSYGYGKSALSMNSRLRTIIAYSSFDKDTTGSTARLMGCGYFTAHAFKGKEFTGRAWFGKGTDENVDPLENEPAHELAEALGFLPRRGGQKGTSILIVDSVVQGEPLIRSVEDWWWPRIVDQDLDVEVHLGDDVRFPKPRLRADLAPFIECYAMAAGKTEPRGAHQRSEQFHKLENFALGSYGVGVLKYDEAQAVKEGDEERLGTIALIRSPRMVVQYDKLGRDNPPAVGVFVADPDVDNILKLSEPPAHNRWEPKSPRLAEAEPDEHTARKVVKAIRDRLKEQIRKLQSQADPPGEGKDKRLTVLEKELGAFLKIGAKGGGPATPKTPVPVEVRFVDGPDLVVGAKGLVSSKTKVQLRLKPTAAEKHLDAVVTIRASVLEDEDENEGELLPIKAKIDSKDKDVLEESENDGTEWQFDARLPRDRWVTLALETEPYDAEWATKFGINVEPRGKT